MIMKTGYRTIQINPSYKMDVEENYSFAPGEGMQLGKFAQVMKLVQELSADGKPFRPEYLFNDELPEEIKLYLRNIFQQRIKGISSSLDLSQITEDDMLQLCPQPDETVTGYASRVTGFINSLHSDE